MPLSGNVNAASSSRKKGWFTYWPRSPEWEADFFKAISVCQEAIKAEGGPPMRLFVMDEPGGHPDTLQETIYYHKLLKEKLPHMQTYVTLGGGLSLGIDELGLLGSSADLITVNRFDSEIARRLVDRHEPCGVYNGGGATESITGYTRDRFFYGFYGSIDFNYQPRAGDPTPPTTCATLDKWRWKIVNACEDLLTVIPFQKALSLPCRLAARAGTHLDR